MTLIYFSNCAVDASGHPGTFMMQELPWLLEHFDRVIMVGHHGIRTITGDEEPPYTTVKPLTGTLFSFLQLPFRKELWQEIRHLKRDGKLTVVNLLKLIAFTRRGLEMHHWAERMLHTCADANTMLYSFWMSYDGYAAAICKKRHPKARLVMRGHAFDIDTERNPMNPYLMKEFTARYADGMYLISQTARGQFMDYMAGRADESKVHVLAMGSSGQPVENFREAPLYTQGVLRVVSCAMIIPIKQVHILAEALSMWEGCPVCWTHIGGGEGEEELRRIVDEKIGPKENVICEMLGTLDAEKIHQLYETRAFDVFVNTSRKEGVPISIMEAMRHGTPVIAPAVGGIPELVTPEVGWLYEPAEGAQGVLRALEKLAALSREEAEAMRQRTREHWNEHYCSSALLGRLFPDAHRR